MLGSFLCRDHIKAWVSGVYKWERVHPCENTELRLRKKDPEVSSRAGEVGLAFAVVVYFAFVFFVLFCLFSKFGH